jgi:hypothetical protein
MTKSPIVLSAVFYENNKIEYVTYDHSILKCGMYNLGEEWERFDNDDVEELVFAHIDKNGNAVPSENIDKILKKENDNYAFFAIYEPRYNDTYLTGMKLCKADKGALIYQWEEKSPYDDPYFSIMYKEDANDYDNYIVICAEEGGYDETVGSTCELKHLSSDVLLVTYETGIGSDYNIEILNTKTGAIHSYMYDIDAKRDPEEQISIYISENRIFIKEENKEFTEILDKDTLETYRTRNEK